MAVLEPYKGGYYLWKYLPSIEAAAIFCIFWVLATLAHAWKIGKTHAWFGIPFAVGGFSMSPCPPLAPSTCRSNYSKIRNSRL